MPRIYTQEDYERISGVSLKDFEDFVFFKGDSRIKMVEELTPKSIKLTELPIFSEE